MDTTSHLELGWDRKKNKHYDNGQLKLLRSKKQGRIHDNPSRGHATLHLAVSVGRSVVPSHS